MIFSYSSCSRLHTNGVEGSMVLSVLLKLATPLLLRYRLRISPKKPFHDIIGTLWLNYQLSLCRVDRNRIGKQFLPVLVNLGDHVLIGFYPHIVRDCRNLLPKVFDSGFDGFDIFVFAIVIQSSFAIPIFSTIYMLYQQILKILKYFKLCIFKALDLFK